MIISCPSCQARYLVDIHVFARGARQVKCGRCAVSWQAETPKNIEVVSIPDDNMPLMRPSPEPANQSSPPEGDSVSSDVSEQPSPVNNLPIVRQRFSLKLIKQIGGFVALFILLIVLVLIVQRLFQTPDGTGSGGFSAKINPLNIKSHPLGEGLALLNVRSEMQFDEGAMRLIVEGEIRNVTDKAINIPDIMAKARGSDGSIIQSWRINAPQAMVAGQASVPFRTMINAPQVTVVDVNLDFIETVHAHE